MAEMTDEQRKEMEEKLKNMSPEEMRDFQKQNCIFCQIVEGKVPSKEVYSDEKCIAILDKFPATPGHVLILPKEHYMIMPQVPEDIIEHLFMVAKSLSQSLIRSLKIEGTNIFVANGAAAGQKAQHFMVHVIPRKEEDGLPLEIPQGSIPPSKLDEIQQVFSANARKMFKLPEPEPKVEIIDTESDDVKPYGKQKVVDVDLEEHVGEKEEEKKEEKEADEEKEEEKESDGEDKEEEKEEPEEDDEEEKEESTPHKKPKGGKGLDLDAIADFLSK